MPQTRGLLEIFLYHNTEIFSLIAVKYRSHSKNTETSESLWLSNHLKRFIFKNAYSYLVWLKGSVVKLSLEAPYQFATMTA